MFRRFIETDKTARGVGPEQEHLDASHTLITVHRANLVEDGYRQLSLLATDALKGIIRVKFVNEQVLSLSLRLHFH